MPNTAGARGWLWRLCRARGGSEWPHHVPLAAHLAPMPGIAPDDVPLHSDGLLWPLAVGWLLGGRPFGQRPSQPTHRQRAQATNRSATTRERNRRSPVLRRAPRFAMARARCARAVWNASSTFFSCCPRTITRKFQVRERVKRGALQAEPADDAAIFPEREALCC
jgi:hypothetical protein